MAPRFSPARPVRVYERVVQQIEEAILSGAIRPGERLPSERELMTQFAVSRATVREALRVVQSAGLVASRPGDPRGPEVLPFSTAGIHKSMIALARVEHLGLGELLQFRMMIEGQSCALAARRRSDQQLARLEDAITAMKTAISGDYTAFGAADIAFHDVVTDIAGNRLLQVSAQAVRDVVVDVIAGKIATSPDGTGTMRDIIRRHRQLLTAIRERDPARAAALVKRHIYEYYRDYVDDDQLPALELALDSPPRANQSRTGRRVS